MKKLLAKRETKIGLMLGIILYFFTPIPAIPLIYSLYLEDLISTNIPFLIGACLIWLFASLVIIVLFSALAGVVIRTVLNLFLVYRENIYKEH